MFIKELKFSPNLKSQSKLLTSMALPQSNLISLTMKFQSRKVLSTQTSSEFMRLSGHRQNYT
jgi:hypothetical protein